MGSEVYKMLDGQGSGSVSPLRELCQIGTLDLAEVRGGQCRSTLGYPNSSCEIWSLNKDLAKNSGVQTRPIYYAP